MNIEEIKEGMYVRTIHGIGKITKIFYESENGEDLCLDNYISVEDDYGNNKYSNYIYFDEREELMFKYSKNIIDLIQIGDILLIKDFVDEACTIFTDVYYIQNENQLFNIKRDLEKNKNMKISKILTKEQFESIAYEVEQ